MGAFLSKGRNGSHVPVMSASNKAGLNSARETEKLDEHEQDENSKLGAV